jgi:hypothetical protein
MANSPLEVPAAALTIKLRILIMLFRTPGRWSQGSPEGGPEEPDGGDAA